jgi:hypothetical protein
MNGRSKQAGRPISHALCEMWEVDKLLPLDSASVSRLMVKVLFISHIPPKSEIWAPNLVEGPGVTFR